MASRCAWPYVQSLLADDLATADFNNVIPGLNHTRTCLTSIFVSQHKKHAWHSTVLMQTKAAPDVFAIHPEPSQCVQTVLFAGRRSSDRVFLLLQNVYCAKHLKGYAGTSAIYAVAKVDAALRHLGVQDPAERHEAIGSSPVGLRVQGPSKLATSAEHCYHVIKHRGSSDLLKHPAWGLLLNARHLALPPRQPTVMLQHGSSCSLQKACTGSTTQLSASNAEAHSAAEASTHIQAAAGPLAGTHAHELMSVTAQLMAQHDDRAGCAQASGPLTLSALLAHLLFLRVNGGLGTATALCDTFGTAAFVSAAMAAAVPQQFCQDMRDHYPEEAPIPEGVKPSAMWPACQLFRWGVRDSGSAMILRMHISPEIWLAIMHDWRASGGSLLQMSSCCVECIRGHVCPFKQQGPCLWATIELQCPTPQP